MFPSQNILFSEFIIYRWNDRLFIGKFQFNIIFHWLYNIEGVIEKEKVVVLVIVVRYDLYNNIFRRKIDILSFFQKEPIKYFPYLSSTAY